MEMTFERLNLEYLQWSLAHGDGRNEKDLRFGQYLMNKYGYGIEDLVGEDHQQLWNEESAVAAYESLLELMPNSN